METKALDTSKRCEKVLLFGNIPHQYLKEWKITSDFDLVARKLRVHFEEVSGDELIARYRGLSEQECDEAAALAQELIAGAKQGARPRLAEEEVEKATRLYMAMNAMVKERKAHAVTTVCGFIRKGAGIVPCASLGMLQERGVPAACQNDIDALLTMVLFKRATGWVSFMGGPGERDGRLTVTHDVLSRRMLGPDAPMQPYYLRGYHGQEFGLTIHTELPRGQQVTVARLTQNLERLLLGRGTVVDSLAWPQGCVNSLLIQVEDLRKLMDAVPGGQYHMVVACGDQTSEMSYLAAEANIEILAF